MEDNKESKRRMSVPAFGDWDMKHGVPDYSMDFSKIREERLQNKNRPSYGSEEELLRLRGGGGGDTRKDGKDDVKRRVPGVEEEDDHRRPINNHDNRSPSGRKRFVDYFQCCIGA